MLTNSFPFMFQVHLYNEHIVHSITSYKQYECVGLDWVQDTTFEEFFGELKTPLLQIPLQLNHQSTFVTDMTYNPFAPKWLEFREY